MCSCRPFAPQCPVRQIYILHPGRRRSSNYWALVTPPAIEEADDKNENLLVNGASAPNNVSSATYSPGNFSFVFIARFQYRWWLPSAQFYLFCGRDTVLLGWLSTSIAVVLNNVESSNFLMKYTILRVSSCKSCSVRWLVFVWYGPFHTMTKEIEKPVRPYFPFLFIYFVLQYYNNNSFYLKLFWLLHSSKHCSSEVQWTQLNVDTAGHLPVPDTRKCIIWVGKKFGSSRIAADSGWERIH